MQLNDQLLIALVIIGIAIALVLIYKVLKIILTPIRILVRIILSIAVLVVITYFVADYFGYDLVEMVMDWITQKQLGTTLTT